jgi:hypothetical protein
LKRSSKSPGRIWLAAALAAFVCMPAHAQSCHAPPLRGMEGQLVRVEVRGFVAGYDQDGVRGTYQGAGLGVGFAHRFVELDAALPYYHLERAGSREHGLGDLLAGVRAPLLRLGDTRRLALGPELVATLPTGAADAGLGMGHVMLMPGVFGRLTLSRFTFVAQLAYGIALTHGHGEHLAATDDAADDAHAHHHHAPPVADHGDGPAPIVNPMNRSELEHALSAAFQWTDWLALTARLAGAVPLADESGEARETVAFGPRFTFGAFDVGAEQELPLVGDPFRYRTVLRLGAQF